MAESEVAAFELLGQIVLVFLALALVDLSAARNRSLPARVRGFFVAAACLAAAVAEGSVLSILLSENAGDIRAGAAGGAAAALAIVAAIGFTWRALSPQRRNVAARHALPLVAAALILIAGASIATSSAT